MLKHTIKVGKDYHSGTSYEIHIKVFADGSMRFMQIIKEDPKIAFEDDSEKLSKKSLKPAEVFDHTFDVEGIPIEYFGGCVLTKARLELPVTPADNAARVNRDLCSPEHKHKSIHRVECFKKYSKTDLYQLLSKLKLTNPSAAAKRVCLSESLDSFSMPCILLAGVLTSKSFIALCQ